MPYQIAHAIGCTRDEALQFLLLLQDMGLAVGYLAVYDKLEPSEPFMRRKLVDGPPSLPVHNPQNDNWIEAADGLLYDFMFELLSGIEIEVI